MSIPQFYTDRVNGAAPRTHETLPESTADGLKALISRRIGADWLAKEFPSYCPDEQGITGTNQYDIGPDLSALVPGVSWPLWQEEVSDERLFDVLEYVGQKVAKPSDGPWHPFFKHHELSFDQKAGQAEFRADVNLLLSRGGTVYEMTPGMQIQRLGSPEVQAAFRRLRPATGDATLDGLIETARTLYLSRKDADRATAIEKLWDAFERLKTIDDPADKKRSVQALLGHIPDAATREVLNAEMKALTDLGNQFQIRHHEVGKHPIPADAEDYVAARMVNVIVYLLEQSGRLAPA
ncbi:hypothetical protein JNB63_14155 [Microbacterium trichothecenolyticum]|uniref:hypothetical protein n=1 Tax=Microbacterium trichothecenolyticum TaxID=69370 RepID=UPI001C6E643E|nr:hypothetical protein [Microbacterium trichothecenolyticum]MBW9121238.1 hypothetical protein [Microbacterium trichothecenolyticum]